MTDARDLHAWAVVTTEDTEIRVAERTAQGAAEYVIDATGGFVTSVKMLPTEEWDTLQSPVRDLQNALWEELSEDRLRVLNQAMRYEQDRINRGGKSTHVAGHVRRLDRALDALNTLISILSAPEIERETSAS